MSEPRFDFYEKVVVASSDPIKAEIDGRLGAVLGRVCDDHGLWSYAVSMYHSGICRSCCEHELRPTGELDRPENFYEGSYVRFTERGESLG